jgi:hypothetical protein
MAAMFEPTYPQIDDAALSGNPALLAGACCAHPGSILIPGVAADALHEIASRSTSTASADEHRLLDLASDLLRRIELTVGQAGGGA